LTIADDGEFVVFKAATTFDDVRRGKLGEGVIASPAVADGRVYIRGMKNLYCFGKK
jgi:outer membrane protein assembly factor BamB